MKDRAFLWLFIMLRLQLLAAFGINRITHDASFAIRKTSRLWMSSSADVIRTIDGWHMEEIEIKKSRFLAYAKHVEVSYSRHPGFQTSHR